METNKENLKYFEANTMKALYENLKDWQIANQKRLLSLSIQKSDELYCCIALTNPTEVVIMDGSGCGGATVHVSHGRNSLETSG